MIINIVGLYMLRFGVVHAVAFENLNPCLIETPRIFQRELDSVEAYIHVKLSEPAQH